MSVDQCSVLASLIVSAFRPEVDQKVADLTRRFPALIAAELRLRLWVVETIVVMLAGEDSTAEPERLDRFFEAFWSDISRHLRVDLPGDGVRPEFDAGLDRLASEIEADRQQLEPEVVSSAFTNRIAAFLGVDESERLGYGYKLSAATKLLNDLPD